MTAIQQLPTAREAAQTGLPTAPAQTDPPAAPCDTAAVPLPGVRGYLRVKRVLDVLLAGTAIVILAPVIACVWAAVLVRLGRPALFLQERVTLNGRRFRLGKFRTMLPVDPARGWVTDEQRVTPFGTWLRATSLDELPSLWNILIGDMSIVGPRPLPSHYLSVYSSDQHRRHTVKAGLTGLAQVSGRNNVPWDARLELDQRYVLLMGPLLDLMIVARTVMTVLNRDGVVEGGLATSTEFPGPYWTPRVRFVPHGESEWAALTPEDEHIATCGFLSREDPVTGETCVELAVTGIGEWADQSHVVDVVTLLVNRARGADRTAARITLPDDAAVLIRAFREAGFHPIDGGTAAGRVTLATSVAAGSDTDVEATDGTTAAAVLTADIRRADDPTPRGAGR